jgi:hypothetical protein
MTKEQYITDHKKIWIEVYVAAIRIGNTNLVAHHTANKAVEDFRNEFGPYEG